MNDGRDTSGIDAQAAASVHSAVTRSAAAIPGLTRLPAWPELTGPRIGKRGLAFVESPLQFLSALETHHHARSIVPERVTHIHVRGDAEGMSTFLTRFEQGWLPEGVQVSDTKARAKHIRGIDPDELLLGDLCSGQIHKALSLAYLERKMPEVVVLDDGLATLTALETLTRSAHPLVRLRQKVKASRTVMAAYIADRLRGVLAEGRLRWHTSLPVSDDVAGAIQATGGTVTRHSFTYLRSLPEVVDKPERVVVLGTALVADGLVEEERYRHWLATLVADQVVTYYPHRRESAEFLSDLKSWPNVRVKSVGLPIELRLAGMAAGSEVYCLPTTAAASLSVLNPGLRITVTQIPVEWWTGEADDSARRALNSRFVLGVADVGRPEVEPTDTGALDAEAVASGATASGASESGAVGSGAHWDGGSADDGFSRDGAAASGAVSADRIPPSPISADPGFRDRKNTYEQAEVEYS